MPEIEIPLGFAQAKFIFTLTGDAEPMMTTLGLQLTGSPDPNDVAFEAAGAWISSFDDSILNSSWTFTGCEVIVGTGSDPAVGSDFSTPQAGTEASGALPQNNAVLVHKRTILAGRHGRGRMYLPAGYLFEGEVNNAGQLSAGSQSNLNTACASLLTALAAGGTIDQAVLLHTTPAVEPTPITSLVCDPVIATQRRRLRH